MTTIRKSGRRDKCTASTRRSPLRRSPLSPWRAPRRSRPRPRPRSSGGTPCRAPTTRLVENLAKEFNATQSEYKVVPVYKGTYPETLNAGIAAFRARQPPHIIQVFDVGTGVMMGAKSAIKPIAEVMKEGGQSFNKARLSLRHRLVLQRRRRHHAVVPVQQFLARSCTTTRRASGKPDSTPRRR